MRSLISVIASMLLTLFAPAEIAMSREDEPNFAFTATDFVMAAAGADEFERQSGQLASQRATDPDVRSLAEQLVEEHAQTTQGLTAAAAEAGIPAPTPQLHPGQQRALQHLSGAAPEDFDKVYLQQQADAHTGALGLLTTYANFGDEAPLQEAAAEARPLIQRHLEAIFMLQQSIE